MRRPSNGKIIALVASVLTIGIVFMLLFVWDTSGNQGVISSVPTQSGSARPDQQLYGRYIDFKYSGKYTAKKLDAKDNDLELYMLKADTQYDKRIAVAVSKLSGGQLTTNSDYNLRKSLPDVYSSQDVTIGNDLATVWLKKDNSEVTVMIPKDDKVAVISLTTASKSDNLQVEANSLLHTFKWQ